MKKVDVEIYAAHDLDMSTLEQLISDERSFKITKIEDMPTLISNIEHLVEGKGLKVRIEMQKRSFATIATGVAATAVAFTPVGLPIVIAAAVTSAASIATATGIGAHNLATLKPDYKIIKNPILKTITVRYQLK